MRSVTSAARLAAAVGIVAFVLGAFGRPSPLAHDGGSRAPALTAFTHLPLAFVENRGQTDPSVRFYAQGPRYAFHFTRDAATFSFADPHPATRGVVLRLRFVGASPRTALDGEERVPGDANYLRGNDPARWQTGVPRFAQVVYRELWPGVDLALRGDADMLKYEYRVRPGARVADIQLAWEGATRLTLDDTGALAIETAVGVIHDARPIAYQMAGGTRVPVDSRYVLDGSRYGFAVGAYDPGRELVIDPAIDYSTYFGGSAHETGAALAVDGAGNAYFTGFTQSPDLPTTAGAFDRSGSTSNSLDAYIAKLNPTGTALVYSTFLGGTNFEWGRALAIDGAGNAYVAGQTMSSNFPTTGGAFDRTFNVDTCPRCGIDQQDVFVTKLNAAGSALVYSTFIGGFQFDDALAIALDASGNAYVAGETGSSNFPVTAGAFDQTPNGEFDAFALKLNAAGSALVYSTRLGGTLVDFVLANAVDASGRQYLAGTTRSPDFPTTAGAFDTTQNGMFDTFVTRLNAAGTALDYSTFLGGTDMDSPGGIEIDAAGNAYVVGGSSSADFPTTPGVLDRTFNQGDITVTKLNATGTALIYSTFIGGSGFESAGDIIIDGAGEAWIAGSTSSPDFPTTPGTAIDTTVDGPSDAFLLQLDANAATLLFSTLFGGTSSEGGTDLAFDAGGDIIVLGQTMSTDFPTTAGALDRTFSGDPSIFWADVFVTKFGTGAVPPPSLPHRGR